MTKRQQDFTLVIPDVVEIELSGLPKGKQALVRQEGTKLIIEFKDTESTPDSPHDQLARDLYKAWSDDPYGLKKDSGQS